MLLEFSERLAELAGDECERRFGVRPSRPGSSTPPSYDLGDIALSFPFEVAKRAGGVKPRDVASAVAPALESLAGVRKVEVAGGGYINVFLDRPWLTRALIAAEQERQPLGRRLFDGKAVIEHTNINPNKAAHIGHVRNAVLGDTLARVLRGLGHEVEVQNYIDDTGVQVADVVVGFLEIEGLDADAVRALPEPFDYLCWDLYARVGKWYEEDEARRERRQAVLHQIEAGGNPTASLADVIARRIVACHLRTAARLGIGYDLLAWEGDILRLGLWAKAFESLQGTEAVRLETEGKNAGCWVMGLEGTEGFKGMEDADKVLVRSNGTATYVAKDIAYQMWKFGLSAIDFHYAPYPDPPAGELWTTTSSAGGGSLNGRRFGHADHVFNVIDVRQSYLQKVVSSGLEALGFSEQSRRSVHYSYEMVAVTPQCAEELGFELEPADKKRPYIEMSGRRGLGVKADDLVSRLEALAARELEGRDSDRAPAEVAAVGHAIAVAALRFFMLRFGRNKVVAFDFEEAIQFTGETGPNLQYSVVRCRAIFRRLAAEGGGPTMEDIAGLNAGELDLSEVGAEDEAWDLVHHLARADEVLAVAVNTLELSVLAKWAFQTAKRFHKYFERFRIRGEADAARQRERAALVWLFSERMARVLDLMGIPVPDRM